jgi:hypothetical protein
MNNIVAVVFGVAFVCAISFFLAIVYAVVSEIRDPESLRFLRGVHAREKPDEVSVYRINSAWYEAKVVYRSVVVKLKYRRFARSWGLDVRDVNTGEEIYRYFPDAMSCAPAATVRFLLDNYEIEGPIDRMVEADEKADRERSRNIDQVKKKFLASGGSK